MGFIITAFQTGLSGDRMIVVMAAFGTTYYIPEVACDGWSAYGVAAKESGACFGPFGKNKDH